MSGDRTFKVRPAPKSANCAFEHVFNVYISATALHLHNIQAGSSQGLKLSNGDVKPVIVKNSIQSPPLQNNILQMSKNLETLYGLKFEDSVTLTPLGSHLSNASRVVLVEAGLISKHAIPTDFGHWAWSLEHNLEMAKYVLPGLVLNTTASGQTKSFQVISVNNSSDNTPHLFCRSSTVVIVTGSPADTQVGGPYESQIICMPTEGLAGLERQVKDLNEELANYGALNDNFQLPKWLQPRAKGIILHGLSGTGKTVLLQMLSKAGWQKVSRLDDELEESSKPSSARAIIHKVFAEALSIQPCLILIDDLEWVTTHDGSSTNGQSTKISRAICKEMDQLEDSRVLIVAATRSLHAIDQNLRRVNRFSTEIEIPVPDSTSRARILKLLSGLDTEQPDQLLDAVASQTHGFVGEDLQRLIRAANKKAKVRILSAISQHESIATPQDRLKIVPILEDYQTALREVIPTALREIFVETPEVRWSDIGGQEEAKETLELALLWPSKYPTEMKRFGVKARKGLLLYGPPGCSKTMIARAAATESKYSFLAVKGAELLNMYVGESERAIRELFRKARSMSPSIIFFDEIDAIGTSRDTGHHAGLNVVTTLLNELDGIEELKGVFVLAATNRPDAIDPALTRAGRLDKMLYVGLPTEKAARQILDKQLRVMDVDETVKSEELAKKTKGFSGAELVGICSRAGEAAARDQVKSEREIKVNFSHFDKALTEVQKVITSEMLQSYRDFEQQHGLLLSKLEY